MRCWCDVGDIICVLCCCVVMWCGSTLLFCSEVVRFFRGWSNEGSVLLAPGLKHSVGGNRDYHEDHEDDGNDRGDGDNRHHGHPDRDLGGVCS